MPKIQPYLLDQAPGWTLGLIERRNKTNLFGNFLRNTILSLLTPSDLIRVLFSPITKTTFGTLPFLDEIKCAPFYIEPYKAPSLDGLPCLFYQNAWEIVSPDLLTIITILDQLKYIKKYGRVVLKWPCKHLRDPKPQYL